MKRGLTILILMGVVVGLAVPAIADDIQPPWWRGEWSTTSQVWEFYSNDPGDPAGKMYGLQGNADGTFDWWGGVAPDGPALNPLGNDPLPSTMLWVTPKDGAEYIPTDLESDRDGIWPLSGIIEVVVDNHDPPNDYKWVWVQLTWRPQSGSTNPVPEIYNLVPQPVKTEDDVRVVLQEDLEHGWKETTYEWFLRPNPYDEWFTIGGDIDVDQLVIDTWCIPEPSVLAMLLGMSLIALAWRRRR